MSLFFRVLPLFFFPPQFLRDWDLAPVCIRDSRESFSRVSWRVSSLLRMSSPPPFPELLTSPPPVSPRRLLWRLAQDSILEPLPSRCRTSRKADLIGCLARNGPSFYFRDVIDPPPVFGSGGAFWSSRQSLFLLVATGGGELSSSSLVFF